MMEVDLPDLSPNQAFAIANHRKKGPVHLDLPKDVMTTILQG